MKLINENDLILIIYNDRKYLKRVTSDKTFHGKGGTVNFSDLVGKQYGIRYGEYDLYEPTMEDIIMYGLMRETQIVFPKDGFYIPFKLNLRPGSRVLEVGTGSGALTFIFSRAVGPEGKVISFEKEDRHFRNARKNLERFLDWKNVEMRHEDIMYLIDYGGSYFDAAFIDVREPWVCLKKVRTLMRQSSTVGMIVPTANQVAEILKEIHRGFGHVEVIEIMLRKYKTVAERVRPEDRMIGHTGYLIFGRRLADIAAGSPVKSHEEDANETICLESFSDGEA
ncbi:MAG: methyltransferase domain-containing protein [Syntrophobacterales bacterium]|jgi:tRNA (adenine57-N1/adenine58-N1)-methyltransferase|nr:methyltransferase domain-containing protein [Syntrophobacterales bacterium]